MSAEVGTRAAYRNPALDCYMDGLFDSFVCFSRLSLCFQLICRDERGVGTAETIEFLIRTVGSF